MLLRIHPDRIQDIKTSGFSDRIHATLSTVKAFVAMQNTENDVDPDVMHDTHEMSISIMISFLCESGVLQGDEFEFSTLKRQVLNRQRHASVGDDLGCAMSIDSVLRHITCLAVSGDMCDEVPSVGRIYVVPGEKLSVLDMVNWTSWVSLQKCKRLGEVVRLSYVVEENLKRRGVLPLECIAVLVRDCVDEVHKVIANMQCTAGATMLPAVGQKKISQPSAMMESFSKMASRLMIEVIVSAVMCTDEPSQANYAYSLLRVNLLDIYAEQYMHWEPVAGGKMTEPAVAHPEKIKKQKNKHKMVTSELHNMQEKLKLMTRTIRQHGRQKVYEQVKKMVSNISGLLCVLPEMTVCTDQTHAQLQATLTLLRPSMNMDRVCASVRNHETDDIGIHLLRRVNLQEMKSQPPALSYLIAMSLSSDLGMDNVIRIDRHNHEGSEMHLLCHTPLRKMPSNLCYVLQNINPVLSDDIQPNNPRYEILRCFRQSLALTYFDIIYSLWATN